MSQDERLQLLAEQYDTKPTVEAIADEIIAGSRSLKPGRNERESTVGVVAFLAGHDAVFDSLVAGEPLSQDAQAQMVGIARAHLDARSMPPEALVGLIVKSVRRMVHRPPGE